jgi:hypothetical protein
MIVEKVDIDEMAYFFGAGIGFIIGMVCMLMTLRLLGMLCL